MSLGENAARSLIRFLRVLFSVLPLLLNQRGFAQTPVDQSWTALRAGLSDQTTESRAGAVRVLGLLPNNPTATELATNALSDEKPEIRAAAADALGQMNAKPAVSKLADLAAGEKEVGDILAYARAMIALGDTRGYAVYYAVLTGEKKGGGSLLDEQKKMLKDPKKMAQFGFEQGIGFIPFAGIGYGGFKMLTKDDVSPVRAAAARVLTKDRDPKSEQALVTAASDKSWIVRMAALESLALRGNPAVVPQLVAKLEDDKDVVRYTAAGAIIRLSETKPQAVSTRKHPK
jgi:HEAT repeat protein